MNKKVLSLKDTIINMYSNGSIKAEVSRFIEEKTGLGNRQSNRWAKRIYDEYCLFEENESKQINLFNDEEEFDDVKDIDSDLEFSDRYVYNKDDKTYLFLLEKKYGKNVKLSEPIVKSIIKNYSNYDDDPKTINEIANRHAIPRNILIEILKILGITHDSIPITPEEINEKEIDDIAEECIENKKFALYQKLQKDDWKQTKIDAKKWNEFIIGKYNPFCEFIESWIPPKYNFDVTKSKYDVSSDNDDIFLCVLTDTHIGELTKNTFTGDTFDSQKAVANIFSYLSQIEKKLLQRKNLPKQCKLLLMGDILNSCVDGYTKKGTKLHNDLINEELFNLGLDVIVCFVEGLLDIFGRIDVHTAKGNHDSFLIQSLYYACEKYFEKNPNIQWDISKYWINSFRVNNSYFIYTHGKDDENHISLPKNTGKNLESYVQSLLLSKVHELVGVKGKYFITGHLHSFEHIEKNDFEFIQVPASVNADDYAESLGYRTKARQNCFIIGDDYIDETMHFYF